MTFRFELTIGWLSIVFDPQPELEDDDEPEPPPTGSAQALDSSIWLGETHGQPEMHGDPDRRWSGRRVAGFRPNHR